MTSGVAKRRVTVRFAGTTMHCGWKANCVATIRLVIWPPLDPRAEVAFREFAGEVEGLRVDGLDVARWIDVMDDARVDDRQHDCRDDRSHQGSPPQFRLENILFRIGPHEPTPPCRGAGTRRRTSGTRRPAAVPPSTRERNCSLRHLAHHPRESHIVERVLAHVTIRRRRRWPNRCPHPSSRI